MSARALVAEGLGTALLLAAVVGSGIMAERLCGGNIGLALLCNAVATGCALFVLILGLGPVSGAHFNPVVTLWSSDVRGREAVAYALAQLVGGVLGVLLAHLMFELPAFTPSVHVRSGPGQWLSELVATAGLLFTIGSVSRARPSAVPAAVAAYIVAAYWFTASTSFANPAVTIARALTDSFAGIRPLDAPGFVVAQLGGSALGALGARWLYPAPSADRSAA